MAKIAIMLDTENVNCVATIDNNILNFDELYLSKYSYIDQDNKKQHTLSFSFGEDIDDPSTGMRERHSYSWFLDSRANQPVKDGTYAKVFKDVHGLNMEVQCIGNRKLSESIKDFMLARKS